MKVPTHLLTDNSVQWMTKADAAVHFGRSDRTIQKWLTNGTCAEFGLRVFKDLTGHWYIGIPISETCTSGTTAPAVLR